MGYALAYCLLQQQQHQRGGSDENVQIRVLCKNKEGLDELSKMGADICQVDYNSEDQVRECFKNVKAGIMIPEHDRELAKKGENVFKSAKNENIEHLCMISLIGVDKLQQGREFEYLNQYCELEKKHREMFGRDKGPIIRCSMVDQWFYLLAPMIEKGVLRLPIKKDQKWSMVDLNDIIEAIVKLANGSREENVLFGAIGNGRKEIYHFAPQHVHQMEELAHHIGEGLGRRELRYEQINKEEIRKWFSEMRDDNRFKERPSKPHGDDKPHYFPIGRYLNDCMIDIHLEIWELANKGRMDISSNDLKELLDREPSGICDYFKNNSEQFREFR
ncbi:hypothetical protein BJ944DRAFT_170224 [Cunninghamella echinulata]|nr:hypothetical protein BJ944DRAFT_170224 [Cunninghamella echinulata]